MRAWLQANLRGAGERSPLPACCTMSVLSFPDMDRAQSEARSPATGQRAPHAGPVQEAFLTLEATSGTSAAARASRITWCANTAATTGRPVQLSQDIAAATPARVRSPDEPLRHHVELRDGEVVPLPLGAQFEIICRQNTVEAALYYFARIERAWMDGSGDNSFRRSTVLMSLIGAPGCW